MKSIMLGNLQMKGLALAAILGPFVITSCSITPTAPATPAPAPRFEGVGEIETSPQAVGSVRVSRFRDNVTGAEYLIVTRVGRDGIAVVPVILPSK